MTRLQMRGRQQTAFSTFILDRGGLHKDLSEQVWLADWKAEGLPYCSLYIVTPDGNWPCKIGISVNASKRLIGLQTSVWKPLRVAKCYWTATVLQARTLEKAIHKRLTEDNAWLHGEWFAMRPDKATDVVEFVALVEGIELYDKIDNPKVMAAIESEVDKCRRNDVYAERSDRERAFLSG